MYCLLEIYPPTEKSNLFVGSCISVDPKELGVFNEGIYQPLKIALPKAISVEAQVGYMMLCDAMFFHRCPLGARVFRQTAGPVSMNFGARCVSDVAWTNLMRVILSNAVVSFEL